MRIPLTNLNRILRQPIFWVFLIAFGVRLFACLNTYIINPDGIHYIHQARSIFYGQWHALTDCHIKYISPLPLLIAAAFGIFRDWVVAGRFISLIFSFATLFPLYFLVKRFFDKTVSALTILVYAFIPFLVSRSADIVRDPVFWFLICSGMLLFVRSMNDRRISRYAYQTDLALSCCLFTLSAWVRIEGVAFILASCVYLLIHPSGRRMKRLFFFSLPLLSAALLILVSTMFVERSHEAIYRTDKIRSELTHFTAQYHEVRAQLKTLSKEHPDVFGEFLHGARNIVWAIPIILIFSTILEGYFYPYAMFFFLGFVGIKSKWKKSGYMGYFVCLIISGVGVLYIHLLQTWLIYNRFLSILLFPSFLFIGFGIENTLRFIETKCRFRSSTAAVLAVVFIVAFGLGKSARPNHEDKVVYRQAGEIIASQKQENQMAEIAGLHSTVYEWVLFYAHRNFPGPICAKQLRSKIPENYKDLVESMRADGIRYLFFEENRWARKGVDLRSAPYQQDFEVLGQWHHKDTGEIMLLELKNL